jgi:hypothetical protein
MDISGHFYTFLTPMSLGMILTCKHMYDHLPGIKVGAEGLGGFTYR